MRKYVPLLVAFAGGVFLGSTLQKRKSLKNKSEEVTYDAPENAPENCPGVESDAAGKADACKGCPNRSICESGEARGDTGPSQVRDCLKNVKHKILILSGKGGVGKSTVASQLAWVLVDEGHRVGLMDIDICGPSIPRMTGCVDSGVHLSRDGWSPVYVHDRLAIMSIGFLLPEEDGAVVWRGPKKNGLIKQFLTDVTWGELDYLIIDTPPGTSDEHLSIVNYLSEAGIDGAILVTTPQEIALQDVRKEISFCHLTKIKILGVIENFVGSIFDQGMGDVAGACALMNAPYAGTMPMENEVMEACEKGEPLSSINPNSKALIFLRSVVKDRLP